MDEYFLSRILNIGSVLIIFLFSQASFQDSESMSTSKRSICIFSGDTYASEQIWFRRVATTDTVFCIPCQCLKSGRVNCTSYDCSDNQCNPTSPSPKECCRICKEPSNSSSSGTQPPVSCLHNGHVYHDGQTFASNTTGLMAQLPNQCVQCVCKGGLVLCRLKTCPVTRCSSPISGTSDCCPVCDTKNSEEDENSSPVLVTIMMGDDPQHGNHASGTSDCLINGLTYGHGSTWHPIIGPFGQMDCVACKCHNGKIECSRINCTPAEKLPCSRPQQIPGQCCLSCADQGTLIIDETRQAGLIPWKEESDNREHYGVLCLPAQHNTIVQKSHASSSTSAYYQYAFQAVGTSENARLLTFTVKDAFSGAGKIGDFSEQHLSKDEFSTLKRTFKFKLIGATRTKFMEKFLRKAKKMQESCGSRCTPKINRLERVLHLQEIAKKEKCSSNEVSFQK